MRKYLPHILIITFVFLLAPTVQVASYAGEIEDAKEEVRKNPDDAEVHNNLGKAYFDSGKWKKAIESYKQVIRIDPDDAKAHANLGLAYDESGKHQEAIESHKQAIKINPDDALAHFNLGLAYVDINDRDSALEQYEILKSLDTEMANELLKVINE